MTAPAGDGGDWLVAEQLAPDTGGALGPLYQSAAAGVLAMPYCAACGGVVELEQQVCDRCESPEVRWSAVAPQGIVHSVTIVHRREPSLVLADRPYAVVDVELDSGHRLVMATERSGEAPAIGQRVTVAFRHVGGVAIPAVAGTTDAGQSPGPDEPGGNR